NSFPVELAPRDAQWITFSAGNGLEGHVFRDGSLRFSGPDNNPLTPGTYFVKSSNVSYKTKLIPASAKHFFFDAHEQALVAKHNFPISVGQSNISGASNSNFDYGEYFGLNFRNGKIYTVTTDNSFDNTQTPIAVFNEVDKKGKHLSPQVDVVPPGYGDDTVIVPLLGETTVSVNPTNCLQLAATIGSFHPATITGTLIHISNDGGASWNDVDPFANIPGPYPTLPGFGQPVTAGDFQCTFDSFGNLFFTPLMEVVNLTDSSIESTIQYVLLSSDGGVTWTLFDSFAGVNPDTFALDYPIIATGPGKHGSAVTWLALKQDVSFDEVLGVGASLPVMVASYKMDGLGVFASKNYQEIPGSSNGGYGSLSVGPDGSVLYTGTAVNNSLGGLPFGNNTIWYSFNKDGFDCQFSPIKLVANTNAESFVFFSYYSPMQHRGTWSHPVALIDKKGRWYISYLDQPTTHAVQSNPNVYLIYSDDKGKHWSSPIRINNDIQNLSFHLQPNLALDQSSNDLAIAWLDTREDELDTSTRVWSAVIKDGSLPPVK
ncbi:MAG: hypothetical protein JSR46_05725, partial [Verrucomicrobia bacterium]|nr:hypothetical protein [Verrucomicrobiota bacterium]